MSLIFTHIVFFACLSIICAYKEDDVWPCYLRKCERSSSQNKFNKCLKDNANFALKYLCDGDNTIGIPAMDPYSTLTAWTLQSNPSFKIAFQNPSFIYGCNFARVENMNWNLNTKQIFIDIRFTNTISITGLYQNSGLFKSRDISSSGIGYLDFLNPRVQYNITYTTQQINGYEYAVFRWCEVSRSEEFPRYYFSYNGATEQQANDYNDYINDNNQEFTNALNPDINGGLCRIATRIFVPIFMNFPLETIFY